MEHNKERVVIEFHDSSSSKKKVKHTPKAAKHRVMKFKNHLLGVVEKTNSSQIKQLLATGNYNVRRLEEVQEAKGILEESPPSLILEGEDNNHYSDLVETVRGLQKDMAKQKKVNKNNEGLMKTLQVENQVLRNQIQMLFTIMEAGLHVAIRAFADKCLEALYEAADVNKKNFKDRVKWLDSTEAYSFCNRRPALWLFEQSTIKVDPKFLNIARAVRKISATLSATMLHHSQPIVHQGVCFILGFNFLPNVLFIWTFSLSFSRAAHWKIQKL